MHSLGAREDMSSQNLGSSFRALQTTGAAKFDSVDSNLKEVSDMATEQKRNFPFQHANRFLIELVM